MPAERAEQSLRWKNCRHQQEARNEAATASTLAAALEQEAKATKTNQLVGEATRQALLILRLNPSQHRLVVATAAAASTGSSPLHHQLLDSPHMSSTPVMHDFQWYHSQTSRLSYSTSFGSPEVSINLNAVLVGGGSSSGGARKRPRELPADAMGNACNWFNRMSAAEDEANRMFMDSLIYDGGIPFDPDETQSQYGRTPFIAGHDGMGY
ncbi:hypothetical protein D1007_43164 [Hordeum vulgare]|nr:hypothetical protein D1007_43164 [Hordeum vulgare]